MHLNRFFPLTFTLILTFFAACGDEGATNNTTAGDDGTDTDETDTTDGGPVDSDEDGLTDDEEAQLGTDPNNLDTDSDTYWDSWEVTEGTDPLDPESRIYVGYWPYNPNKDLLDPGDWGSTSTAKGARFPRFVYIDQHGDEVDSYDFVGQADGDGKPKWQLIDVSAQWCPPCHNVASWLSGVDDAATDTLQAFYPTVREKVSSGKVFWITFIVEDIDAQSPTANDAIVWDAMHSHPLVPVLIDADQRVLTAFGVGSVPHFFLLKPDATIGFFPVDNITGLGPYPAVGMVDKYL